MPLREHIAWNWQTMRTLRRECVEIICLPPWMVLVSKHDFVPNMRYTTKTAVAMNEW